MSKFEMKVFSKLKHEDIIRLCSNFVKNVATMEHNEQIWMQTYGSKFPNLSKFLIYRPSLNLHKKLMWEYQNCANSKMW